MDGRSLTPSPSVRLARTAAVVFLAAIALGIIAPYPARAFERRRGETVAVRLEEVIDDDVLATGQDVTIAGTVRGDVVAFARSVVIRGRVEGDVLAFAQSIEIDGEVAGSARLAAQTVTVAGRVGRNLMTFAQHASALDRAQVGGNWLAGAQQVTLRGTLGRSLLVGAEQLRLAGTVGRDVEASVRSLMVEPGAAVGGTLTYRSPQPGRIDPGARVGAVRHIPDPASAEVRPQTRRPSVFQVLRHLGFVGFGMVLVAMFPGTVQRYGYNLQQRPLASLLLGFGTLAAAPVGIALVALTVAGLPVALFLAGVYLGALYAGQAFLYPALTAWMWRHLRRPAPGPGWGLVLGSTVFALLGLVPYLGSIVRLVAASWTLGLTILVLWDAVRTQHRGEPDADRALGGG